MSKLIRNNIELCKDIINLNEKESEREEEEEEEKAKYFSFMVTFIAIKKRNIKDCLKFYYFFSHNFKKKAVIPVELFSHS